jgi:hypothetical protein
MGYVASNLADSQQKLQDAGYNTTDPTFVNTIFKLQDIQGEALEYKNSALDFSKEFYNKESSKYSYEIAFLVLLPLLVIGGIGFYFWKKPTFILLSSIVLFALIIPAFVIMGLNTSYFLMSIDFCQNIKENVLSGGAPTAHRGIGFYISCPSKVTQRNINTGLYELGNSFNHLIENINTTLFTQYKDNIGINKRNNTQFDNYSMKYANETNLSKGIISLKYKNDILAGMYALTQCQEATSVVNYLEDHYCYKSIDQLYYVLIFYFIGIVGLILLTIGINKLIVLLNPTFLKKGTQLIDD